MQEWLCQQESEGTLLYPGQEFVVQCGGNSGVTSQDAKYDIKFPRYCIPIWYCISQHHQDISYFLMLWCLHVLPSRWCSMHPLFVAVISSTFLHNCPHCPRFWGKSTILSSPLYNKTQRSISRIFPGWCDSRVCSFNTQTHKGVFKIEDFKKSLLSIF